MLAFIFRFATDEVGLDWASRRIEDPDWTKLNEYAEFFRIQKAYVIEELQAGFIPTMECPLCNNKTFDTEAEVCVLCGHRESICGCKYCPSNYLDSLVRYSEAGLCMKCEYLDDEATATHEKY